MLMNMLCAQAHCTGYALATPSLLHPRHRAHFLLCVGCCHLNDECNSEQMRILTNSRLMQLHSLQFTAIVAVFPLFNLHLA